MTGPDREPLPPDAAHLAIFCPTWVGDTVMATPALRALRDLGVHLAIDGFAPDGALPIGSLAVGYPLQLWPPDDPRLRDTVDYLLSNCLVGGGFFQDMTHSGINAYLTLHMAQVLLRAGDPRYWELMTAVVNLATPTGQWPEAIHPATGGGCMGDGQHAWAAAEWLLMMRNCFVREEADRLVLASGIPTAWQDQGQSLSFGPAPTPWGTVSLTIAPDKDAVSVAWQGAWRGEPPVIEVRLPGFDPVTAKADALMVRLDRERVA